MNNMTDAGDKSQKFLDQVEVALDLAYQAVETAFVKADKFLSDVREQVAVLDEQAHSERSDEETREESISRMVNDIANHSESVRGIHRSSWRKLDQSTYLDDEEYAQLRLRWASIPNQFKTAQQPRVKNPKPTKSVLDTLNDLGKNFRL